jgi:hypothetical protein
VFFATVSTASPPTSVDRLHSKSDRTLDIRSNPSPPRMGF